MKNIIIIILILCKLGDESVLYILFRSRRKQTTTTFGNKEEGYCGVCTEGYKYCYYVVKIQTSLGKPIIAFVQMRCAVPRGGRWFVVVVLSRKEYRGRTLKQTLLLRRGLEQEVRETVGEQPDIFVWKNDVSTWTIQMQYWIYRQGGKCWQNMSGNSTKTLIGPEKWSNKWYRYRLNPEHAQHWKWRWFCCYISHQYWYSVLWIRRSDNSLMFRQGHPGIKLGPEVIVWTRWYILPIANWKTKWISIQLMSIEKVVWWAASTAVHHSRWYGTFACETWIRTFEAPQDISYFVP